MSQLPKTPIVIAAFGASTTRGWRPGLHNYQTFRLLFERDLCDRDIPAVVMDAAQPGNTSIGGHQRFERDVLTHNPDAVLIDFGINDSALKSDGTYPRVQVDTFKEIYLYWITILKARNIPIVSITPQPFSKPDDGDKNDRLAKYAAVTKQLGKDHQVPVVDIYADFQQERENGKDIDEYYLDGIHLNVAGNRFVADQLLAFEKQTGFFAKISARKNRSTH